MLFKNTVEKATLNLLKDLNEKERLKDFFLAGGTALSLQIGHRKSIDLDFFTLENFSSNEIADSLSDFSNLEIINSSQNTLLTFIDNVKADFIRHHYPLIKNIKSIDGFRIASIEDISAMKLNAINNRGAKKDFYDLYFLLNEFKLTELIKLFEIKYPAFNRLQLLKSLLYFQDAENQPDPVLLKDNLSWKEVKKEITIVVSQLLK